MKALPSPNWLGFAAALALAAVRLPAQTDGAATFQGTIVDYNGAGTAHWTVAWVTYENGVFIKSLRKQGPSWTSTHWNSHCKVWNDARGGSAAGSQSLDGYSSATAASYTGTNSPVIWTWNCRDANNSLVPDGNYKFWIQYAEDSGQGPHTTNGMLWVKGPAAVTNTYPNVAANFTGLRVAWTPAAQTAPAVFSALRLEGNQLLLSGTGAVNQVYHLLASTNAGAAMDLWTPLATNTSDATGRFTFTNTVDAALWHQFYRVKRP